MNRLVRAGIFSSVLLVSVSGWGYPIPSDPHPSTSVNEKEMLGCRDTNDLDRLADTLLNKNKPVTERLSQVRQSVYALVFLERCRFFQAPFSIVKEETIWSEMWREQGGAHFPVSLLRVTHVFGAEKTAFFSFVLQIEGSRVELLSLSAFLLERDGYLDSEPTAGTE